MLPVDNFINSINIKTEIPEIDDVDNHLMSSSMLDDNQTAHKMKIKFEIASIQYPHDNGSSSFLETSSSKNLIGLNLNQLSTPIIKHESSDIETETYNMSYLTAITSDVKTSLFSIKDESSDELVDIKNDVFNDEHSTKFEKRHKNFCDNNDIVSFPETSSSESLIGMNFNQLSTSIIKYEESIDIKSEVHVISDPTCIKSDLETSLISIKDEHKGALADFENYGLNEHATESNKKHCNINGKNFSPKRKLNHHCKEVHATTKEYICDICNKGLACKYYLKQHIHTVHDKIRDWKCTKCEKAFSMKCQLKKHELFVHLKIRDWKCTHCNKTFVTKQHLQFHERTVHLNIRDFTCAHCKQSFTNKFYLKHHERTVHLKIRDWKCTHCNKTFVTKQNLQLHERSVHLNIREWKCTHCNKSFVTKQHLQSHEREIHLNIRDFTCAHCKQSFTRKSYLKQHERTVHLKIRDFTCTHCKKSFGHKSHLKQHERTVHLKIRDWKCGYCEKYFAAKNSLKRHERIHEN